MNRQKTLTINRWTIGMIVTFTAFLCFFLKSLFFLAFVCFFKLYL